MEAPAPLAPRLLSGRYRLGPLLGRGGMGEVFDGYDERLHRAVAVKMLRPEMAADPGIRDRFEVEARAAAALSHPNVVAVFDTGEDDGVPFIVMERLPGDTLADRMEDGVVDQTWLRQVAGHVLAGLGAAHAAGLVHRDVKPGNILLDADGRAKVADFGIAKSLEQADAVTGVGLLVGTPAYLAPERIDGLAATPRSDLYSVGVVLYEALAGAKPFSGATPLAVADAVLRATPSPLAGLRPDVDPDLAEAVRRAMARDPSDRPVSAAALAGAIAGGRADGAHAATAGPPGRGVPPGATVLLPSTRPPVPLPADATLVGAPGPAGSGGREGAAVVGGGAAGPGWGRRRSVRGALVAAAAVAVVLVALVAAGGGPVGGAGRGALVADIHALADQVAEGDGSQGPAASERLDTVADHVAAGGGAGEANALLADAAQWTRQGELSAAATGSLVTVLARIEGVDPALAAPPSTAAVTTVAPTTTPAVAPDDDEERGKRRDKERDD